MKSVYFLFIVFIVPCVLAGPKGVAFDFGNEWLKVAVMDSDAYQLIDIVVNEVANRYQIHKFYILIQSVEKALQQLV